MDALYHCVVTHIYCTSAESIRFSYILYVCDFNCVQNVSKSHRQILLKCFGEAGSGPGMIRIRLCIFDANWDFFVEYSWIIFSNIVS